MTTTIKPEVKQAQPDISHRDHLIDDILPAREFHLWGGSSGSGKSSICLKLLENFDKGLDIFGHKSHPVPFVYVVGDRSKAGTYRTMERLGIDPKSFPLMIAPVGSTTINGILDKVRKDFPHAKLIVIEGIAGFVPGNDINNYGVVATFCVGVTSYCTKHDVTVLGIVHSPKQKEKDRYNNPRDKVMGSGAWGGYTETLFFVEAADPEKANAARKFSIHPRNAPEQYYDMEWQSGLLVEVKKAKAGEKKTNYQVFTDWFSTLEPGTAFTHAQAKEATMLPDSSFKAEFKKFTDLNLATPYKGRAPGTYIKQSGEAGRPYTEAISWYKKDTNEPIQ